jgi:type II secretion system protein J
MKIALPCDATFPARKIRQPAGCSRVTFHVPRTKQASPPTRFRLIGSRRFHADGSFAFRHAFTLIEILIAITILALVLTAIYSSWTAILRASRVGRDAAASVQRSRIALRLLQDSLASARLFVQNQTMVPQNRTNYDFIAENGEEATLSFVARLAKSFPRAGKFGDLDVRRVTFSVEAGPDSSRQLVLRQSPLLMELDADEKERPVVLAKNVKEFQLEFWDMQKGEWIDEWTRADQLPRVVRITLQLADNAHSVQAQDSVTRIVSLPAFIGVQPIWQRPPGGAQPGRPTPGGPGTPPGGQPSLPPGGGGKPVTSQ